MLINLKAFLFCILLLFALPSMCAVGGEPDETPEAELPKLVLIGDSIRLSYTPIVAEELGEEAVIVSPPANGQDSANVLRNLTKWVIDEQPDVVHFNAM
jgi:hypothetical protein